MKKITTVEKLTATKAKVHLEDGTSYSRKLYYKNSYWNGAGYTTIYLINFNLMVYKVIFSTNELLTTNIVEYKEYDSKAGQTYTTKAADTEAEEDTVVVEVEEVKTYQSGKTVKHKEFETIKTCVENNIPVYLAGPAGSGKNHTLKQIAEELDMEFYFTNSVQQEYKITGFIDAGGNYHQTEFYKAFVNGGLFFLDEMDASIPEVLVLLNAAIANGYFEFPNGKVDAHEDFRVVAAGNTFGNGADEQYTGRLVLDQATLDRFVVIEFDYDYNIELALAGGNEDLVNFVRYLRNKSKETGIRTTFSYRTIMSVKKLEKAGMPLKKILIIAVFKGMDQDTINTLKSYSNKSEYHKQLMAL